MQSVTSQPRESTRAPQAPGATVHPERGPESRLARFTRLAAELAGAPVALLTLVGDDGVVVASQAGLPGDLADMREIPRSHSLCSAVAEAGEPVALEDARVHRDFAGNGAVREWGLVAYAGVPIRAENGVVAAVLAVADKAPRAWSGQILAALGSLAGLVDTEPELNRQIAQRAEARLRASESRFRALIENSSDVIVLLDAEGVTRYVSPAMERYAGYSAAETVGTRPFDRMHPDDLPPVLEAHERVLREPSRPVRVQYRYRHRNGSWRVISSVVTNLLDDPAVGAIVVNSHDLTQQVELEAQLRQTQKMEAVGQLAGGVAHDFNNMLTAITGFAALLELSTAPDARERIYLREIQKAAARSADLTHQLLAFSRKQILCPRLIRLGQIVSGMEGMLRRLIGEHVTIATVLTPAAAEVDVDTGQMEQVLLNLAVNARDAMPDGGTLTIETACVEMDEREARALGGELTGGRYALLAVSDTGAGMDAETLERIFEPFFTTKEVGRGTGLGLSTVYGIVKQSGGHLFVASEPGRGSRFTIYLPLARSEAEEDPDAAGAEPVPTARRTWGEGAALTLSGMVGRVSNART